MTYFYVRDAGTSIFSPSSNTSVIPSILLGSIAFLALSGIFSSFSYYYYKELLSVVNFFSSLDF
jgi:hypothetical protein